MKSVKLLFVVFVFLYACNSGNKSGAPAIAFGIHEVVTGSELPTYVIDSLLAHHVVMNEQPRQSIIGYLPTGDTTKWGLSFAEAQIQLVRTAFAVGSEGGYVAIIAIKCNPVISHSDIQKSTPRNRTVELQFTLEGSKKWAELTKSNIGKQIAFVIDNQVYGMPEIRGVINEGTALISGLESEELAQTIADRLNAGL